MATFNKRTIVALTGGIWLAAIGSAAALTYDLNRPLDQLTPRGSELSARHLETSALLQAHEEGVKVAEPVLNVPTITIVGQSRPRAAPLRSAAPPTTEVARDISDMRCAEPRQLDMGSGSVIVCE